MRIRITIAAFLFVTSFLNAQRIPPGTLLPAMLNDTVDSDKNKPGDEVFAKLMQDVPLPNGGKVKRGSRLVGHVVSSVPASPSQPAKIVVQFDTIEINKKDVPIATGLRALASMRAVSTAQQPVNANSGNGTSAWDWNMIQVGGQAVFNGQRVVKSQNGQVMGKVPEPGAVLAVPLPNPTRGCSGTLDQTSEQAFWVFSTDACGIYGYRRLTLDRQPSNPPGQIILQSPTSITVRGGSGWLLQVSESNSTLSR